ncbi:hypothetical protein Hanom_Chr15g01359681 [Helianthus anomalus]
MEFCDFCISYLENAMSEAAFSINTPFGPFIPAKLALCRARGKIYMTCPSKFGYIITRRRTFSGFIFMIHINLLNVTNVCNRYIHGPTRVQIVIVHSIHPLIGMHLKDTKIVIIIINIIWFCEFLQINLFFWTKGVTGRPSF